MPEETRYFTLSGNVPNGGVPPGRTLASLANPPSGPDPAHHPFRNGYGPPPPYSGPQDNAHPPRTLSPHPGTRRGPPPYHPTLHPGPPPPAPPYEPPGQYLDGHLLHGAGWSYLLPPGEHTTIHFVGDGTRPCDDPRPRPFAFTRHKIPSRTRVRDLIRALGAPEGDGVGVTQMLELGDGRFVAGLSVTRGGADAGRELGEVGWRQGRGGGEPIWIVVLV
ncbi:hypothetical protein HO173_000916 [Letharia columbiana]|uniref:Uncharacterized protein n=1 Tax=Letharia columbiana TaxID=112416 RepID=A0A8H6G5X5_9LECA|nr:uncharacterized protein HO173_000916 [Letharia columbiana]KAF6241122.1 hypothetical protein HO173_000916 [Letharia columbiana]